MIDEQETKSEAPPDVDPVAAWLKRNLSWLALGFALVFFVLPYVSPFEGANHFLNYPQRFSEWTLRKLQQLFSDYGYYVVFFGVLMENTLFLGLIVPGSVILVLGGLSAQNGSINLWFVVALAIAATIIGDTISYMVGRMGWMRLLHAFGMGEMIEKARGAMESHGWFIVGYHFTGYTRLVGPPAAGMFRVPYRRWALLDHTGGILWVIAFTSLGVILGLCGLDFGDTKRMSRFLELFFTALIVSGVAVAWYRTTRTTTAEPIRATAPGVDE